jgi:Protein of unknown function (DUF3500)
MKNKLLLKLLFGTLVIISLHYVLKPAPQVTFKIKLEGINNPDSLGIVGSLPPLTWNKRMLMEGPDAAGFYSISVSFPDSVAGQPLNYSYRYGNRKYDVNHSIKLEHDRAQVITDKWGYLDGMSAIIKPSPGIDVFQPDTPEEAAEFSRPFVGVTTDGKPIENLFPLKKTGVNIKPIKNAVNAFLNAITKEQREKCSFPVESNEWRKWHNVDFYKRTGIGFEELNAKQKDRAFDILKASLSPKGVQKSTDIMKMEEHLAFLTNDYKTFGGDKYWLVFMGTPSDTEPWGWQLDGHHLIINYFLQGDQVVMTPTFMGSEPTYIESGKNKGLRTFKAEEEKGLAFYGSLTQAQKDKATIWHHKDQNFNQSEAYRDNAIIPTTGIAAKELSLDQKNALLDLVAEYVDNMKEGQAKVKMEEVRSHLDETHFTWVQGKDITSPFYYRIHSPVILIEFDHQVPVAIWDRSKPRPGPVKSHIHTVVRTPNGNDYGKDLLKEHLKKHRH